MATIVRESYLRYPYKYLTMCLRELSFSGSHVPSRTAGSSDTSDACEVQRHDADELSNTDAMGDGALWTAATLGRLAWTRRSQVSRSQQANRA